MTTIKFKAILAGLKLKGYDIEAMGAGRFARLAGGAR